MVNPKSNHGMLNVEMSMALAVLLAVVLPLAYSVAYEIRMCRLNYYRAVAMEIVDGEMEVLAAGEWRTFGEGTHAYAASAAAVKNLPAGQFLLTVKDRSVRLEWTSQRGRWPVTVRREVTLK